MKWLCSLVVFSGICSAGFVFAAEVRNLKVGQEGDKAIAVYELIGTAGERSAEVTVAIVIDGKRRTSDQLRLSGDFGKNVTIGPGKRIVWDAMADLPAGFDGDLNWDVKASRGAMPATPSAIKRSSTGQSRVGFVDVQKILLQSKDGRAAKANLTTIAGRYENEKAGREEKLKRLKAELEKQGALLSDEIRREKEADYQEILEEYKKFLKDAQEELQKRNDEMTSRIVGDIVRTVKEYGRENGYEYIFVKSDALVYQQEGTEPADLSDEIVRFYDASR